MPIRETPNCVRFYALIREEWEPVGEMFTECLTEPLIKPREMVKMADGNEITLSIDAPPWFVWFMEWNRSLLIPKISRN